MIGRPPTWACGRGTPRFIFQIRKGLNSCDQLLLVIQIETSSATASVIPVISDGVATRNLSTLSCTKNIRHAIEKPIQNKHLQKDNDTDNHQRVEKARSAEMLKNGLGFRWILTMGGLSEQMANAKSAEVTGAQN